MTTQFDDILFLETMISHHTALYRKYRNGWRFKKAAFAWKRLQHYKSLLIRTHTELNSLLTEINNANGQPIITVAG